ncbi:MAG TPA: 3-hydroxyacyl-CoA dehydrogenase, partial [Alphaproteobacteria bacterium]|nr:3-hydroxyacyl-CoA dehydrogenase [Alphaproteobacteria bacterium]
MRLALGSKIGIVGCGLIGRAWAIVFARGGAVVAMFDPDPKAMAAAPGAIRAGLEALADEGLLEEMPAAVFARIDLAKSLAQAVAEADYVQENAVETLEAKRQIFAELDRLAAPQAILASSTSSIPGSLFTETLAGRARCLVAHPVNPPHLVPLVELVPTRFSDPQIVRRAKELLEEVGQVPIVLDREIEGFVLNRLQAALLNEAFRLVEDGYVSTEDIDKTVKKGLGLRWSFMGPFETIDLNAPG